MNTPMKEGAVYEGPWPAKQLASGGDGPHDGGMLERVVTLEQAVIAMKDSLARIDRTLESSGRDLGSVRVDTATITTKLASVPTRSELYLIAIGGLVVVVGALWGALVLLAKPWADQIIAAVSAAAKFTGHP